MTDERVEQAQAANEDRSADGREFGLVVVNAGTSDPSSTRMLADRVADRVTKLAGERDARIRVTVLNLRDLATEITTGLVTGLQGPGLTTAAEALAGADGVIAASPVYKAEASGLFTSFFHVLDRDLLIGTPVLLTATAGTARHALVVDGQMRSLFAYLRTLTAPTSLFASSEDWGDAALTTRIERAATELWLLMELRFPQRLREATWSTYQHDFGSASGTEFAVDFEADLMSLTGGRSTSGA